MRPALARAAARALARAAWNEAALLLGAVLLAPAGLGAEEGRQRLEAPEPAGWRGRVGAELELRPAGRELELESSLGLELSVGSLSLRAAAPASIGSEGGRPEFALGELELGVWAAWPLGPWRGVLGAAGKLPACGAGPGPAYEIEAGLEAARILDPVALGARARLALGLPARRSSGRGGAEGSAGLELSFAEALNSRVALGLGAELEAELGPGRSRLDGGAAAALALSRGELSFEAALSWGLGPEAARGAALVLGIGRSFGWGGR
ncbi:MAG TPA: hypothetical protein PLB91_01350 [Spirochaetales bacterium]|nr:hypothetical protein [Spirochaetales bacterium]HRY56101.1 hypothetical protein [Spirochaetia bacterium]HRZ63511.1 hypothetical protein [Spirochaetia bacterium]